MLLTITNPTGAVLCSLDVELNDTVENLQVLLEIQTGIPMSSQQLIYQSKVWNPLKTIGFELGTSNNSGEARVVLRNTAAPVLPTAADPHAAVAQLFGQRPAAVAPSNNNTGGGARSATSADDQIARLFAGGSGGVAPHRSPQQTAAAAPSRVPLDPMDPEYQRRLMEQIEKQNLEENFFQAMEHTPEAFARVVMLYVPCEVNKVPLTAFVDSGAQMSIMSLRMAEKCGLVRLMDKRMAGVAKGVGTCRILGRVHMTMVKLGGIVLPFSISVLERQDMDFLIGLDQLRAHQMCINLKKGVLSVAEGVDVPFLGEGELPEHLRKESAGTAESDDEGESTKKADTNTSKPSTPPPATAAANNNNISPVPAVAEDHHHPKAPTLNETSIATVVEITGVDRVAAIGALEAVGGDVDAAVALLLE